jgi:hypothetical protein
MLDAQPGCASSLPAMPHLPELDARCALVAELCRNLLLHPAVVDDARRIAAGYPHVRSELSRRSYSENELLGLFLRDGFVDRYSGNRLVFPGTLRLLSVLLPNELPFQEHWRMSDCHPMYWDLCPTLDHCVPLARGGSDDPSNWVTTSMRLNQAKANWTIEEVGWTLHPSGRLDAWDGLTRWFLEYVAQHPEHREHASLKRWHRAADRALEGPPPRQGRVLC